MLDLIEVLFVFLIVLFVFLSALLGLIAIYFMLEDLVNDEDPGSHDSVCDCGDDTVVCTRPLPSDDTDW